MEKEKSLENTTQLNTYRRLLEEYSVIPYENSLLNRINIEAAFEVILDRNYRFPDILSSLADEIVHPYLQGSSIHPGIVRFTKDRVIFDFPRIGGYSIIYNLAEGFIAYGGELGYVEKFSADKHYAPAPSEIKEFSKDEKMLVFEELIALLREGNGMDRSKKKWTLYNL